MIKFLLVLWWWFRTGGLTQLAEEGRYRRRLQLPARRLDAGETQMSIRGNTTGETAVLEPPLEERDDVTDTPAEPLLTDEVPHRVIDVVVNVRLAREEGGIYAIRVVGLDSQHPQLNALEAFNLAHDLKAASDVVSSIRTAAGFQA